MELPHAEVGRSWAAARETGPQSSVDTAGPVLHLDTAAAGRTSRTVRAAVAAHLDFEARVGGYVAEATVFDELRAARGLLGELLGFAADDLALVESSSAALAQLLASWPLREGDRVWVVPSEWGPNLAAFSDRGLKVELLDTDEHGLLDLESLERRLAVDPPALLHLTTVAAHRPLVQPVAAAVALCQPYEVPVLVDAAQALAQVPDPAPGAAAVYGTGRKYLCGPRGMAYLGVRDPWQQRLVPRAPAIVAELWPGEERLVRRLESREASVASRIGLAAALREYHALGPAAIMERLAAIGAALRSELADLPGLRLAGPATGAGVTAVLAATDDTVDLRQLRADLLDRGVLCTVGGPERAPNEMTGLLLRFSPHVDLTRADLARVADEVRAVLAGHGPR